MANVLFGALTGTNSENMQPSKTCFSHPTISPLGTQPKLVSHYNRRPV